MYTCMGSFYRNMISEYDGAIASQPFVYCAYRVWKIALHIYEKKALKRAMWERRSQVAPPGEVQGLTRSVTLVCAEDIVH